MSESDRMARLERRLRASVEAKNRAEMLLSKPAFLRPRSTSSSEVDTSDNQFGSCEAFRPSSSLLNPTASSSAKLTSKPPPPINPFYLHKQQQLEQSEVRIACSKASQPTKPERLGNPKQPATDSAALLNKHSLPLAPTKLLQTSAARSAAATNRTDSNMPSASTLPPTRPPKPTKQQIEAILDSYRPTSVATRASSALRASQIRGMDSSAATTTATTATVAPTTIRAHSSARSRASRYSKDKAPYNNNPQVEHMSEFQKFEQRLLEQQLQQQQRETLRNVSHIEKRIEVREEHVQKHKERYNQKHPESLSQPSVLHNSKMWNPFESSTGTHQHQQQMCNNKHEYHNSNHHESSITHQVSHFSQLHQPQYPYIDQMFAEGSESGSAKSTASLVAERPVLTAQTLHKHDESLSAVSVDRPGLAVVSSVPQSVQISGGNGTRRRMSGTGSNAGSNSSSNGGVEQQRGQQQSQGSQHNSHPHYGAEKHQDHHPNHHHYHHQPVPTLLTNEILNHAVANISPERLGNGGLGVHIHTTPPPKAVKPNLTLAKVTFAETAETVTKGEVLENDAIEPSKPRFLHPGDKKSPLTWSFIQEQQQQQHQSKHSYNSDHRRHHTKPAVDEPHQSVESYVANVQVNKCDKDEREEKSSKVISHNTSQYAAFYPDIGVGNDSADVATATAKQLSGGGFVFEVKEDYFSPEQSNEKKRDTNTHSSTAEKTATTEITNDVLNTVTHSPNPAVVASTAGSVASTGSEAKHKPAPPSTAKPRRPSASTSSTATTAAVGMACTPLSPPAKAPAVVKPSFETVKESRSTISPVVVAGSTKSNTKSSSSSITTSSGSSSKGGLFGLLSSLSPKRSKSQSVVAPESASKNSGLVNSAQKAANNTSDRAAAVATSSATKSSQKKLEIDHTDDDYGQDLEAEFAALIGSPTITVRGVGGAAGGAGSSRNQAKQARLAAGTAAAAAAAMTGNSSRRTRAPNASTAFDFDLDIDPFSVDIHSATTAASAADFDSESHRYRESLDSIYSNTSVEEELESMDFCLRDALSNCSTPDKTRSNVVANSVAARTSTSSGETSSVTSSPLASTGVRTRSSGVGVGASGGSGRSAVLVDSSHKTPERHIRSRDGANNDTTNSSVGRVSSAHNSGNSSSGRKPPLQKRQTLSGRKPNRQGGDTAVTMGTPPTAAMVNHLAVSSAVKATPSPAEEHHEPTNSIVTKYIQLIADYIPIPWLRDHILFFEPILNYIAVFVEIAMIFIIMLVEFVYEISMKVSVKLAPYKVYYLAPSVVGLVMCFFGGQFMTIIATVEAYRSIGYENTVHCVSTLMVDFHAVMEANAIDDAQITESEPCACAISDVNVDHNNNHSGNALVNGGMADGGVRCGPLNLLTEGDDHIINTNNNSNSSNSNSSSSGGVERMLALDNFSSTKTNYSVMTVEDDGNTSTSTSTSTTVSVAQRKKPDVLQITSRELLARKTMLFLRTVDPHRFMEAVVGINAGFIAVVATLKVQFAKTITLGNSISKPLEITADTCLLPIIHYFTPSEYRKWCKPLLKYTVKTIAITIAWMLRKVMSSYHSAIRGGLLFSKNIFSYLYAMKCITIHLEESIFAYILGYGIAFLGIYFQCYFRYSLPFPLNILLFPFTLLEWLLIWCVNNSAFVMQSM